MAKGDEHADPPVAVADHESATTDGGKDPGWYARGRNPNEQSYWDGTGYTGTRHWVAGRGWIEGGPVAAPSIATVTSASTVAPGAGPQPSPGRHATMRSATFSLGGFGLIVSGIALMYGSVAAWVTGSVQFGTQTLGGSLGGTDPGLQSLVHADGWITFIGGTVILVFGGLLLLSEDSLFAALTCLVSLAVACFATYDMVRVIQKVSHMDGVSVGAGLICVLAAATLALLISGVRVLNMR